MKIDINELKKQMNCECNVDSYPTDAWCPIGCGIVLVCMEDNLYYCANCDKHFKIIEK